MKYGDANHQKLLDGILTPEQRDKLHKPIAKLLIGNKKLDSGSGWKMLGLSMTPHAIAGFATACPMAVIAGCASPCLNFSGRGSFDSVQFARFKKRYLWETQPEKMIAKLKREIANASARFERLVIRLNVISDIPWHTATDIIQTFPNVTFIDYSKVSKRLLKELPDNYHLTASLSGAMYPKRDLFHNLSHTRRFEQLTLNNWNLSGRDFNMAMVVRSEAMKDQIIHLYPDLAYDMDLSDYRHLDGANFPGRKLGLLRAKGGAITDTSGFVYDWDDFERVKFVMST